MAERRAESYPAPGALPEVRPGSMAEDLARRDFTVNAIALSRWAAPAGASCRRRSTRWRIWRRAACACCTSESFIDDPTRLLRLARYSARLGFEAEAHTAQLAAQALAAGALATISRARVGAELRLALGEADALAALAALDSLGVLAAIDPELSFDERAGAAGAGAAAAATAGRSCC